MNKEERDAFRASENIREVDELCDQIDRLDTLVAELADTAAVRAAHMLGKDQEIDRLKESLASLVNCKDAGDAHYLAVGGDPPAEYLQWRNAAWSAARAIVQEAWLDAARGDMEPRKIGEDANMSDVTPGKLTIAPIAYVHCPTIPHAWIVGNVGEEPLCWCDTLEKAEQVLGHMLLLRTITELEKP